jgi:predicted nucleic acid-binding Zn ribbon protein
LGDALGAYIKRSGLKRRLDQASVIPEWPELVGPKIAEVGVTSAAWMQELQLMSADILRRLGERGKKIKRIVWRAE